MGFGMWADPVIERLARREKIDPAICRGKRLTLHQCSTNPEEQQRLSCNHIVNVRICGIVGGSWWIAQGDILAPKSYAAHFLGPYATEQEALEKLKEALQYV